MGNYFPEHCLALRKMPSILEFAIDADATVNKLEYVYKPLTYL